MADREKFVEGEDHPDPGSRHIRQRADTNVQEVVRVQHGYVLLAQQAYQRHAHVQWRYVVEVIVELAPDGQRKFIGPEADLVELRFFAGGDEDRVMSQGAQAAEQRISSDLRATRGERRVRMAVDGDPPDAIGAPVAVAIREHVEPPR